MEHHDCRVFLRRGIWTHELGVHAGAANAGEVHVETVGKGRLERGWD